MGYMLDFIKKWHVVGQNVCDIFRRIMDGGSFDGWLNKTLIVLIPKVPIPRESIKQFRLISLCTVIYETVTKVIVNRLKLFLPKWILPNQASFVPGGSITDNIVIAPEIVHSMQKKSGQLGWIEIKVDLEEAYDRLNWNFIDDTLGGVGILSRLRKSS